MKTVSKAPVYGLFGTQHIINTKDAPPLKDAVSIQQEPEDGFARTLIEPWKPAEPRAAKTRRTPKLARNAR